MDRASRVFFIGGKQGSTFHATAWHKAKASLTKHCPLSDKTKEIICCFDDTSVNCHIPWGQLGESLSRQVLLDLQAEEIEVRTFCFAGAKSFRPAYFQFVLDHKPQLVDATKYFKTERKMTLLDRPIFFLPLTDLQQKKCDNLLDSKLVTGAVYLQAFPENDDISVCDTFAGGQHQTG